LTLQAVKTAKGDGSALHAAYASIAEIVIDAPASLVWPHVLDMGSWVDDFHFEHVSGEVNGEGAIQYLWPAQVKVLGGVATVPEKERTADNATTYKTLKIIPERLWYAVSLPKMESGEWASASQQRTGAAEENIRSTGGFLIWLAEAGGKTRVTAMRTKESLCPTEQAAAAMQESMTKYQPVAQSRWTGQYLPRLKALVEKGAAAS
jgi:hypothetical protein